MIAYHLPLLEWRQGGRRLGFSVYFMCLLSGRTQDCGPVDQKRNGPGKTPLGNSHNFWQSSAAGEASRRRRFQKCERRVLRFASSDGPETFTFSAPRARPRCCGVRSKSDVRITMTTAFREHRNLKCCCWLPRIRSLWGGDSPLILFAQEEKGDHCLTERQCCGFPSFSAF